MAMIFKLQRPLFSNEKNPLVLIYNEDRSIEMFAPFDEKFAEMFGDDSKQYWNCEIDRKHNKVKPIEQVEEQDW